MDATLLLTGAGLVVCSIILCRGVERLIRRIGAGPAEPGDRSRGFRDIPARLEAWQRERASQDDH